MKDKLKQYFGYDSFRPGQEEVIKNILSGNDTFVLMPTGGGKSICYQLPALIFEGMTLVVSPLIALMKDQVDALKANGISAEALSSSMSFDEIDQVKFKLEKNQIKLLYVAPERLANERFRDILKKVKIDLIAIDEAHCISEWGHDFRPEYRNLSILLESLGEVPIVALTATATEKVRTDIIQQLKLENPLVFVSSFNRENLSYHVLPKEKPIEVIFDYLKKYKDFPVIVYCISRDSTEKIAKKIRDKGFVARPYHAGLSSEERAKTQEEFIKDKVQIIVATIAFGMGINKPDVRLVIHYDLPKTIENYYQETGRAGRDGLPSECLMLFNYADKVKQDFFINKISDARERANAARKLNLMVNFAVTSECRRKILLNYFGEGWQNKTCDSCDNCGPSSEVNVEKFDATEITQKILSAMIKTGLKFGISHVIGVLRGSNNQKILERNHNSLSVYGIAKDFSEQDLRSIVYKLVDKGILKFEGEEYPILRYTTEAVPVLKSAQKVELIRKKIVINNRSEKSSKAKNSKSLLEKTNDQYEDGLFQELRKLRRQIADEKNIAPFMVFSDVSLKFMSQLKPTNLDEFADIHGVGKEKLSKYGDIFTSKINDYLQKK